ncbi:MAG: YqaA family protein [Bdellovibrionota bacterium]|nr:YqaA family protein [Bdellovibrionota bacterium]
MELWILFSSSFLSATLLPGFSEANIIYLGKTSTHSKEILVAVATLGNSLGGLSNYVIGVLAAKGIRIKYFEKENTKKSVEKIKKYGSFALIFAWLPIIGDPLCLAAGYLRISFYQSCLFITLGKFLRYTLIVYFL